MVMHNETGMLCFNLEEPDARLAFKRASSATDAYMCLWDMREMFKEYDAVECLSREFYEIMERNGISLDDLP